MKEPGQVVIFKFPQTNLEYTKARPALLLEKSRGIRTGSLPGQEASNNKIEDEAILSTSTEESDGRPEPQEGDKDDE